MKKKYIYVLFCVVIIIIVGVGFFVGNIYYKNDKKTIEKDSTVVSFGNEYNYSFNIGDVIDLKTLVDMLFDDVDVDNSNFELMSNGDTSVVEVDTDGKIFMAISEGNTLIQFKLDDKEYKVRFYVGSVTSNVTASKIINDADRILFDKPSPSDVRIEDVRTLRVFNDGALSKNDKKKIIISKIQNFAITGLGTTRQRYWYSYDSEAYPGNTYIVSYKKGSNNLDYMSANYFLNGGHGQSFEIIPVEDGGYVVYTGAKACITAKPVTYYNESGDEDIEHNLGEDNFLALALTKKNNGCDDARPRSLYVTRISNLTNAAKMTQIKKLGSSLPSLVGLENEQKKGFEFSYDPITKSMVIFCKNCGKGGAPSLRLYKVDNVANISNLYKENDKHTGKVSYTTNNNELKMPNGGVYYGGYYYYMWSYHVMNDNKHLDSCTKIDYIINDNGEYEVISKNRKSDSTYCPNTVDPDTLRKYMKPETTPTPGTYYSYEYSGAYIVCIDPVTGDYVWGKHLYLKPRIKNETSKYGNGNWETEGIKIYKNGDDYRMYIGYKLGSYNYSGIISIPLKRK